MQAKHLNATLVGCLLGAIPLGTASSAMAELTCEDCPAAVEGSVCCCDEAVSDVTVCVEWDLANPPESPSDFAVDFECTGCDAAPNLELKKGAEWIVRAREEGEPDDLASFGTISSPRPDDFVVQLGTGYPHDLGAAQVDNILLDPQGAGSDANYSTLAGGAILSHLNGDITLQESSGGSGGLCSLRVGGDVHGDITVPKIKYLVIAGALDGSITAEEIVSVGALSVGDFGHSNPCGLELVGNGPIEIGTMNDDSFISIFGDLSADLTVTDAIGTGCGISITGTVDAGAVIDLADIDSGGFQSTVTLGHTQSPPCPFEGTLILQNGVPDDTQVAIVGTMAAGSSVNLTGDGVADILSIVNGGSGTVVNGGAVSGVVTLTEDSTVPFSGSATFASVSASGTIRTLSGADLSETVTVTGTMAGSIAVSDQLSGDVQIGDDLTGSVDVGDDMPGDLEVTGDVTDTATITIGGGLGRGRILIDGLMDGVVTITEETGVNSLIHLLGGLGEDGSITINADEGDHNAGRNILVGPDTIPLELDPITYDGCIEVRDNGSGGYGDLAGDLEVVGCHATDDDLGITIEGDLTGDVIIVQTDCENQVDWSACP